MSTATEPRVRLPAELRIEDVVAIIDQAEQTPLILAPMRTIVRHLYTSDYTLAGWEEEIAYERKSLPDLIASLSRERERFYKEILRLRGYPTRGLIVEATWSDIREGHWRSKVSVKSVVGSLRGIESRGIPVTMAGNHEEAGRIVRDQLFHVAKKKWAAARNLVGIGLKRGEQPE